MLMGAKRVIGNGNICEGWFAKMLDVSLLFICEKINFIVCFFFYSELDFGVNII